MSVLKKLMQARMTLQAREVKKSGWNDFSKYHYMSLADFLIPTQEIFAELGLCGLVSFTADTATLTITDTEDGTAVVITSPMGSCALKGCHEVQNIGAVETYQRRYLWVTAMEIVEHDALDSGPPAESLVPSIESEAMQAAAERITKAVTVKELTDMFKKLTEQERAPLVPTFTARRKALEAA